MSYKIHTLWLTIAAENVEALVLFYTQILDQSPQIHINDRYAEFRLPQFRLGIFKPHRGHREEFDSGTSPSKTSLSLCLEVSNLEEALLRCQNAGATFSGETIEASHGREHYAYDPLGNRIILYEPVE
ncbi:MAG: VOC family protein [Prochlorotrichaceae cyanobacterium]